MPNVGLVLSGGFAKGAYQIGVLNAIREFFAVDEIKYISASSIGVLNAYAFMRGKIGIAESMWLNLQYSGFRSFVNNYIRGSYIMDAINEIVSGADCPQSIFYTACFNVSKIKLNYINLNNVHPNNIKDYLQASVMLPVFSRAIEISGMKYVDGALVDNIPVRPLMKHPLDYAIVIHFDNDNYLFENDRFDRKLIKINFLDDKIIKNSLSFDQNSISYMINSGYEESLNLFNTIFKNGIHDVDYIYKKIELLDGNRGKKNFRLTGDVVVNNINRVLKKVVAPKI